MLLNVCQFLPHFAQIFPEFCQNSPKFAGIQNPDASRRIRKYPEISGIGTSSAEIRMRPDPRPPLLASARSSALSAFLLRRSAPRESQFASAAAAVLAAGGAPAVLAAAA